MYKFNEKYIIIGVLAMSIWVFTGGCATNHRYDDAPAMSFAELAYPGPVSFASVDGVGVAYVDMGPRADTAVVLIHGLGENSGFWEHNMAALAQQRRVLAIDLPGYGRSDKPELDFSMAYYADVVDQVLQQAGVRRAVLVGHSMGGQVSLTWALRHPERMAGLILAAPAGIETFDEGEAAFLRSAVSTDLYMNQTEDQIRSTYQNNLFFSWRPEYETLIKERVRLGRSPEFKAYAWAVVKGIHAMLDGPVYDQLGAIQAPVLVLFGYQDALIPNPFLHGGEPREIGERAVGAIPHAELEMIDEAGHMLQYERPERFNAAVLRWLDAKGL